MRYLFLALSFLILSFSLYSKRDSKFSGNLETYIEELENYMSNLSDIHEVVVDDFVKAWEEDSLFTLKEQEDIVELSQKLDKKNARPYPHFVNFLKFYMLIKEKGISQQNYEAWLKGMDHYLSMRRANSGLLNELLEFSNYLIDENLIYKSTSTSWKAKSADYKIVGNKGLTIVYDNTDLVCYTKKDSILIFNTSGVVDPEVYQFKGKGGTVNWERAGYSAEQVYAKLNTINIELKKSEYTAPDVQFTNTIYLDEPLLGELNDKVRHASSPENATYPKFQSYAETFELKNIYENVDYKGGLSMQGAKLVGSGTQENPAKLYIYKNDTLVLEAGSLFFGFKSDRVSSLSTSVSIKLQKDSIYHPDLFFSFRTENRELNLTKTDKYSSQGPYSNSYHKVDMNFDMLTWRLNEDYMKFSAARGAAIGNASFESENYFNLDNFIDLQMMDQAHPLIIVRSFSRKYGSEEFPVVALADYLKMPVQDIKHLIMRLANSGFVFYDSNTEMVTVKPRLHDYLAASVNKIDYDVMSFTSSVEMPRENAIFNLKNYDLVINGIPRVFVSDSQNVVIYPKYDRIIFKRNRSFQFDGVITAGLLTFFGQNLFFSYDSFKVNLQNVDSVNFNFLTGELDNYGLPRIGGVNSTLQNVTGEILIDKADNKSGRVSYPEYPIFKSKETSYVYYNNVAANEGVYNSNDFYFAVEPFEMDSLDNFKAEGMMFKGKFVSAGIFPEIDYQLSIQDDNSLGFHYKAPESGMPIYEGKGTYHNDIWLSNQGLIGGGTVDYLTSTIWSEEFSFFPDSMNTQSTKFQIRKQSSETQYPSVQSSNNYIHWEPYADKLWAEKTTTDLNMFSSFDSISLSGDLLLEPSGLSGWGRMDLRNSDMISENFVYKSDEIFADTSDFYLKSLTADGLTVLTENVNSHIDYRQQKGWFKSNEEYTLVTFPENKYISYIDYFVWDMQKKTLAMGNPNSDTNVDDLPDDEEPIGPRYISTDPKQDSLNFVSALAYYDYQNNYINATGVKFIEAADARIYPKDGLVTVQPNFFVKRLIDSRIVANTTSKFHTLHSASIEILSRKYYHGMANYDYIDENGDKQIIHFSKIEIDDSINTVGKGEIYTSANFTLSPVYNFQGDVFLYAPDSLLRFKGAARINHLCDVLEEEWLNFDAHIDPNDIYLPVQLESKNIDRRKIYNGMFLYYDSVHVYPTFLNMHKNYSDHQLIKPFGYLYYDRASHLFKIGSKEKIKDFTLSEDYISLHREDCKIYEEGEVDLGENLGQVELVNYGSIKHDLELNHTELDLVMGINFFISDEMINVAGNEIDSFPNLTPVNLNRSMITKTMNKWVGEEKANQLKDEITLLGTISDLPKELKYTILLNELHLEWNQQSRSYQSVGKIGIASINGIQINKQVEGFFELRIKRSGDIMDLYLQLDRRNYYYFGYTRGVMQVLSSNRTFTETIMNMKTKERKLKSPKGETPYNYLISTDRKKNMFYRHWQNILNGEDEDKMEDSDIE